MAAEVAMNNSQEDKSPLLDREQLQMLVEAGAGESVEMLRELLSLFAEESEQKLDELRASKETGDYARMSRAAHALAGSSANVGGRQVWIDAKEIEDLCKAGNGPVAAEKLPRLIETYRETLLQLNRFADQLESGEG